MLEDRPSERELLVDIKNKVDFLTTRVESLETRCVQFSEFKPIQMLVYGFVGLTLTAIMGSLVALVIK